MSLNKMSEVNIIRMCLFNQTFRVDVFPRLQEYMFSDVNNKELFQLILSYSIKTGKFPRHNMETLIFDNPWSQDATVIDQKLQIVRCELKEYEDADMDFYLTNVEDWIKKRKFYKMLSEAAMMHRDDAYDYGAISVMMQEIEAFSFQQDQWVDSRDEEYMLALHNNPDRRIKFASTVMNELLGGGLKHHMLMVLMGGVHVGKSRLLLSLATDLASVSPERNILYITLEIDKDTVLETIDSHYLQMEDKSIMRLARDNPQEYRRKRRQITETHGRVIVREYAAGSVNAIILRNELSAFEKRGIKFDAICIDYIALMSPIREYNSLYEKGQTAVELRALSQQYGAPIITPTQPNKDGDKKSRAGGMGADLMDVAESKGIPEHADVVISLIQTPEQYKQGVQTVYWLKNRPGHRVHESILLEVMPWYQVKIMSFTTPDDQTCGAVVASTPDEARMNEIMDLYGEPNFDL